MDRLLQSGQRFYGSDGGTVIATPYSHRTFSAIGTNCSLAWLLGMSIALYQYTVYQNQQVALLKTLGASYRTISLLIGCLILEPFF